MADLTQGYTRPPANSKGGVDDVYIFQHKYIDSTTFADGEVTALTLTDGQQAFRYGIEENLSNFQDVLTHTIGNGTQMSDQTFSLILNDMLKSTRNELINLGTEPVVVIVKTAQGDFKLLGFDYGLRMETASGDSGTAKEDRNGFVCSFRGQQKQLAYDIASSVVDSILVVAS